MSDPRDQNKFMVRLPDGMRVRIATLAKISGRSMNAEIIHRLQKSMDADELAQGEAPSPTDLDDRIHKMNEELLLLVKAQSEMLSTMLQNLRNDG